MPDIQLRFGKDMLVLSAPIDEMLARQGVDAPRDRQYLNLMEPDSVRDALRLEAMAGAQCIVSTTEDITQARLAHLRMDSDASRLARAALDIVNEVQPQHVLAEIGPCGLPLDASSKASLNENRMQYANAARSFEGGALDAFFLNGFTSVADLKCALMGVAQVSDKPVIASVSVGEALLAAVADEGLSAPSKERSSDAAEIKLPFGGYSLVEDVALPYIPTPGKVPLPVEQLPDAIEAMLDLGASVVGFETADPISQAVSYANIAVERAAPAGRPVLAQLRVTKAPTGAAAKNLVPLEDIAEYTPDTMANAAVKLYGAGVQFLRATGKATPAFTGALAATVAGLDVRRAGESNG